LRGASVQAAGLQAGESMLQWLMVGKPLLRRFAGESHARNEEQHRVPEKNLIAGLEKVV
jgi:hypothetical protein